MMQGPFDKYTFRCSSLGKITGDYKESITDKQLLKITELSDKKIFKPLTAIQEDELQRLILKRDAPPELPDTCTTYLKEVYYQVMKGFYQEISSKYMEKGKFMEEAAITLLWKTMFSFLKVPPFRNTTRLYNEFIEGEYDVKLSDIIVDIKNCYDWLTFKKAFLNSDYDWQLRGYLVLSKCKEAILFYCLMNLPDHMLQAEFDKHFYSSKLYISKESPDFLKACEDIMEKFNFEKYPEWERFKAFKIVHEQEKIKFLYGRIIECREWLNKYHESEIAFHNENRLLMNLPPLPIAA